MITCAECKYPYPGERCDNPACWSNMSPARRAEIAREIAREKAEEAERKRIRQIRYRAMTVPVRGG